MTAPILTQTDFIVTPRAGLTVRTTRSMRSAQTWLIIPAGSTGKVLEYNAHTNKLMIDFGIANYAQAVDPRSDAIEILGSDDGC